MLITSKWIISASNNQTKPFIIFQILGCICLGFASYALVVGGDITALIGMGGDETPAIYTSCPTLMIVVSVAVIIVTFFGCYGACKKSQCMLGTYFAFNIIAFICVLVAAIIGYVQGLGFIEEQLTATQKYYGGKNKALTETWDLVQQEVSTNNEMVMNKHRVY